MQIWRVTSQDGRIGVSSCHTHPLHRNTDFDDHPWMRVPLKKPKSPVERFQHSTGSKNLEVDGSKKSKSRWIGRVRKIVSLFSNHSSSNVA